MALAFPVETPAQRSQAMSTRLAILEKERANQASTGNVDPELDREIARTRGQPQQTQQPSNGFNAQDITDWAKGVAGDSKPSQLTPTGNDFNAKDITDWATDVAKAPPPQSGVSKAIKPVEAGLVENFKKFDAFQNAPAQVAANQITGVGSAILGGWRGLATLASGGTLEDAANAVHQTQEESTYQPPAGSPGEKLLGAVNSKWSPLTWVGTGAKKLGEVVQDVANLGANELQQNHPDLANWLRDKGVMAATATETTANAAPLLLLRDNGSNAGPTPAPRGGGLRGFAERQGLNIQPEGPQAGTQAVQGGVASQGAPVTISKGVGSAAEAAQAVKSVPEQPFREVSPVAPKGQVLPPDVQAQRAAVLQRIGLDKVRESAITGDAKAAATDFQTSRLDNSAGNVMKATLDNERQALTRHAEGIVADTGGSLGTDQSALYSRGNTILRPLDSLKNYFNDQIKKLYAEADAKAGGIQTPLDATRAIVNDEPAFLGTVEGEALLRGVKARMKSLGMVDKEGAPQTVTAAQAERLKQYLGDQWQPRTSKLIGSLKDAIDEDVTSQAGGQIYAQARAIRRMRAVTLDDPKGISKIMDSEGPEGINRSVPVEKVPDAVTALPADQLEHIVRTLQNVPEEIQPQAQAAINEIKAQFANKVLEAGSKRVGQWGARDVTRVLNQNARRMSIIFEPSDLAKLADLNEAGHILSHSQTYPGAAVQQYNLLQRGAMGAIRAGSAAVGGVLGGGFGAGAGDLVGSGIAGKYAEHAGLKAAQKRIINLSDVGKK